jgi:hypothetical protein
VEAIRCFLQAELGTTQVEGHGVPVHLTKVAPFEDEAQKVENVLSELMEDGVHPASVAILGPNGPEGPVCRSMLRRHGDILEAFEAETYGSGSGCISSIRNFRGLEAQVVLLVDLDDLPPGSLGTSLLYIGMTRASASLHLFLTDATAGRLTDCLVA